MASYDISKSIVSVSYSVSCVFFPGTKCTLYKYSNTLLPPPPHLIIIDPTQVLLQLQDKNVFMIIKNDLDDLSVALLLEI